MTSSSKSSSLTHLASVILDKAKILDSYLEANNFPQPSHDVDANPVFPLPEGGDNYAATIRKAQEALLEATNDIEQLVEGHTGRIRRMALLHADLLALRSLAHFKIPSAFPIDSETTFTALAKTCSISEPRLRQLLRQAMALRIFAEPRPGIVVHTAASAALVRDPTLIDWLGLELEDIWPAANSAIEAIEKFGPSQETNQTGFNLAFRTSDSFYATIGKDPERARRFGSAMGAGSKEDGRGIQALKSFPWQDLGAATVVDVGGNHGHTSMDLARAYPSLNFVVQDLPEVIANGRRTLPNEFKGRLRLMEHDFFSPQPVIGADVYFFRWVLHNWPDKYAIKILKALVPALKKGATVLLQEIVLPESGRLSLQQERYFRPMDLILMVLFNSQIRTLADWKALFTAADPRFVFKGATKPEGSILSLIRAVWEG